MRQINMVIVHCSATKASMNIGAEEIRKWHTDPKPKGNGWSDIGYHYVIRRNGEIDHGRDEQVVGAHCEGHNQNSLGVCLVGGIDDAGKAENNFTPEQFKTLENLLRSIQTDYPGVTIYGHREFSKKECPSFDVQNWLKVRGI